MSIKLGYHLKEGIGNLSRNKKSTFGSIAVMFCTLFLFGLFLILSKNLDNIIMGMEKEQGIEVFIKLDATREEINVLGEEIKKIDGVNSVTFKSKEQALNLLKEQWKDNPSMLDGLVDQENFLPASYVVKLTELSKNNVVKAEIEKLDNIKSIQNKDELISIVVLISRGVKTFIMAITIILIIVSTVIISNAVKLSVYSRRKEISIMKYIGATNSFVRAPFIIETFIVGLIAMGLSILVLYLSYGMLSQKLLELGTMNSIQLSVIDFTNILPTMLIYYAVLAIGIGVIGSTISMKKHLEV